MSLQLLRGDSLIYCTLGAFQFNLFYILIGAKCRATRTTKNLSRLDLALAFASPLLPQTFDRVSKDTKGDKCGVGTLAIRTSATPFFVTSAKVFL